jgi:glycosyltransferase involved in cell wall biosynthesis
MATPPIFLHSLFRTGSTYIWNKFRQNDHYYCYYEPFHQAMAELTADNIETLLTKDFAAVNHPPLDNYYLYEYKLLLDHRQEALPFYKKSFGFDEFCFKGEENPDLRKYIDYLLAGTAERIPLLQFNRSALRVRWFKKYYPGALNIYLLRNPWDQWSSYFEVTRKAKEKIFFVMDLLTASVNAGTGDFQPLAEFFPLVEYHRDVFSDELKFYRLIEPYYSLEEKYAIFYYTWLKSLLENVLNADVVLNLNRLSVDTQYRKEFESFISRHSGKAVEFQDAAIRTYEEYPLGKKKLIAIETDIQQLVFSSLAQSEKQQLLEALKTEGNNYLQLHPPGIMASHKPKEISTASSADSGDREKFKQLALILVDKYVDLEKRWQALENHETYERNIRRVEDRLSQVKSQLRQSRQKEREMEMQLQELEKYKRNLERNLSSLSWRLTSPFRWIVQRLKPLYRKKTTDAKGKMKIAIDVTPVLPGGDNGGIKLLLWELLKRFSRRENEEYILLTASKNHDLFNEFNMKRICVLDNSAAKPGLIKSRIFNPLKKRLKLSRSQGILQKNAIPVLFCPFAAPTFLEPGTTAVSVIADLQHFYYPYFFSKDELKNRNHFYERLRTQVDYVIAISEYTRKSIIEKLNFPPGKVTTIPIAIQCQHPQPPVALLHSVLEKYDLLGKTYCLYPANFWPHKNHQMLVTAIAMFHQQYPAYDLHLVLTGEQLGSHDILVDSIKQMGIVDRVHFTGFLPGGELAAIWKQAHFLIHPGLFEGFGIPLIEAMRYEKPILASNVTSIPEVAGDAALYFDPRKPGQMVDTIRKIMEDRNLYERLVKRGREQLRKYDIEEMVNRYVEVLQQAGKQNPSTGQKYQPFSGAVRHDA